MKMGVSWSRSRISRQHFHAGAVRHHQIEQDQVVVAGFELLEPSVAFSARSTE